MLRSLVAALSMLALAFMVFTGSAQAAPANDDFAAATPLSGPPLSVEFDDNFGATKQSGEPNHAGNAGGHSVWYRWTPATDAHAVVSTCTINTGIDTLLAVYTGSAVNGLTPVVSNDERAETRCHTTDSEAGFDADAGTTYWIAVDGKNGSEGEFELVLRGTPPNDEFGNAQAIVPGAFITGDTSFAGKQAGEPNHAGNAGGHSVWYSWTPANSGSATISTCTLGGAFDALLAIYTGVAVDGLTQVASSDGGAELCSPADGKVTFDVGAGTTYWIAVDGKNGSEGSFGLSLKARPDNDEFAAAMTLAATLPSTVPGTTAQAGKQAGEPNHGGNAGGHSVWYSWTPANSGPVRISTCSDLLDGSLDSLLAVYTGSEIDDLTPVASNDDANVCLSTDGAVEFTAGAGTTYRIAVDGRNGSSGNFTLQLRAGQGSGGGGEEGGGGLPGDVPSIGADAPPALQALPLPASAPQPKSKPRKCKRGFKKVKRHGKTTCVKKKVKRRR